MWNTPLLYARLETSKSVEQISVLGYALIGIALILSVQAKNVFPQLLLARLLFSVGGAASSTMVTATLTTIVTNNKDPVAPPRRGSPLSPSVASDTTITPQEPSLSKLNTATSPTRLAGFVGLFTGCGALLALAVFLRIPEFFERFGASPGSALIQSYYIVGAMSLVISLICFAGLRDLNGENGKGWRAVTRRGDYQKAASRHNYLLLESISLGLTKPSVGLAYLGGFVARASSVGISLFIPLSVNHYFIKSGLCQTIGHSPSDIKQKCPIAFKLAAELTGVSQLSALLCAPIFGYVADRYHRSNMPLLAAASVGLLGYNVLALLESPKPSGEGGTRWIFVVMALLGISQIGAIVCSLSLLQRCVLGMDASESSGSNLNIDAESRDAEIREDESQPLLPRRDRQETYERLKGSIAGVYSLIGGVGILLLTKIGGLLFDTASPSAPFYVLAAFNGILLIGGAGLGIKHALAR